MSSKASMKTAVGAALARANQKAPKPSKAVEEVAKPKAPRAPRAKKVQEPAPSPLPVDIVTREPFVTAPPSAQDGPSHLGIVAGGEAPIEATAEQERHFGTPAYAVALDGVRLYTPPQPSPIAQAFASGQIAEDAGQSFTQIYEALAPLVTPSTPLPGLSDSLEPYSPYLPENLTKAKIPEGVKRLETTEDPTGLLKELPGLVSRDLFLGAQIETLNEERAQVKRDIYTRLMIAGTDKMVVGSYQPAWSQGKARMTLNEEMLRTVLLSYSFTPQQIDEVVNAAKKVGNPPKPRVEVYDLANPKKKGHGEEAGGGE